MDERDIVKLEEYADKYFPEPSATWPKNDFDLRAYSRWAVDELLERMMHEAMKLPEHISGVEQKSAVEIIREFMDETQAAYFESRSIDRKSIFFIAMDTARTILDLFQKDN